MGQNLKQEAELLPRDPHDAQCQLKSWPTVVRIMETDCVLATAMFCSATCTVLYAHYYSEHVMLWMASTYFCTTSVAISTGPVDRSCDRQIQLPPELLMTSHMSLPAHHRGRGRPWQMDTNFRQ